MARGEALLRGEPNARRKSREASGNRRSTDHGGRCCEPAASRAEATVAGQAGDRVRLQLMKGSAAIGPPKASSRRIPCRGAETLGKLEPAAIDPPRDPRHSFAGTPAMRRAMWLATPTGALMDLPRRPVYRLGGLRAQMRVASPLGLGRSCDTDSMTRCAVVADSRPRDLPAHLE
jgi:hypothetical protein